MLENSIVELYPWIHQTAKKYCKNIEDAEDLAEDTIYKILLNKDKFDTCKDAKPWFHTIMRNTFLTRYSRDNVITFVDDYDTLSSTTSDSKVEFKNILYILKRCLHKTYNVECVILYAKGYTYEEISNMLGIPIGTVRSRISSGRKILRNKVERDMNMAVF